MYYNYKFLDRLWHVTGSSKSGYTVQFVEVINEDMRDFINDY